MNSKNVIVALMIAGVCFILLGTAGRSLFEYAPLVGWIAGIVLLLVATGMLVKRQSNRSSGK